MLETLSTVDVIHQDIRNLYTRAHGPRKTSEAENMEMNIGFFKQFSSDDIGGRIGEYSRGGL